MSKSSEPKYKILKENEMALLEMIWILKIFYLILMWIDYQDKCDGHNEHAWACKESWSQVSSATIVLHYYFVVKML